MFSRLAIRWLTLAGLPMSEFPIMGYVAASNDSLPDMQAPIGLSEGESPTVWLFLSSKASFQVAGLSRPL